MNFLELFIDELGEPTSIESLSVYINYVIENSDNHPDVYTEKHHLLPRSRFKEYSSDSNNIFTLEYSSHCRSHELLSTAYPIQEFMKPLNFMLNNKQKKDGLYFDNFSTMKKNMWRNFSKEKYNEICSKMSSSSIEFYKVNLQARVNSAAMSKSMWSQQSHREKVSESLTRLWKNTEFYNKMLHKRREQWTPEAKQNLSNSLKKRYSELPKDKIDEFRNKMKNINQDPAKRQDASEKIKKKWEDAEFRNKMSLRKSKPKHKILITFPDGSETIEEGFDDMLKKYNFHASLVRCSMKTGIIVESNLQSTKARNTINHKFKRIKNETNSSDKK